MQKVLIFGVGQQFKKKEAYIKEHFEIIGFLDNNTQNNNLT